ncbi:signal peptidase I [Calidifontibacter sp. DB0510]|uniref:Signal peptidase I n=2 Tax=Metallococcus carri TaxID=1656884 RepID=A0A967B2E2_9MICO|nr:signal peptidase I [Metallococcus carri]NOP36774.1 signal peptidase I [Calidifontibacter sp. DB2511S]
MPKAPADPNLTQAIELQRGAPRPSPVPTGLRTKLPLTHKPTSVLQWVRELAIVIVAALVLSLLIKTFVVQPFSIPSGSMQSTLEPGDRVLVSKLTPGVFDLRRGDVVVFSDPDNWLDQPPAKRSGVSGAVVSGLQFVGLYPAGDDHLIKRLIGLPGDKVACCDQQGRLTVNGVPLTEPYLYAGAAPSDERFSIVVPPGRIWVMGDHRNDSADSRAHDDGTGKTGSVPIDKVTGRAIGIIWPVGRGSWLSNYSTTFDKVPDR